MNILHTVNKSAFTHSTLKSCLAVCTENDGLLLLEDGVFNALTNIEEADTLSKLTTRGIKIYALHNDVKARGIGEKIPTYINLTDYDGFVQLTLAYHCVQSWY